ncbi:response regulator [Rhodocaloribacter litoris]|uniref:response regulator n=1 Tax=Rhodocaloribacter litoris TaxID=2558931 RepID=UPI001E317AE6|nr:response regulator [Rhodocaloribacter litoris]QXD15188.1 response regulator [Rhodocaloribacter litoris]
MLVEDNEMDVELTLNAFREVEQRSAEALGGRPIRCTVSVAGNGQEALDYVFGRGVYADRTRYPVPDLILLDLKMPGIDGCEVLRQIKEAPEAHRTPVVMLTSSEEEEDRIRSYRYGANSYLVKPMSFDAFSRMISTVVTYWCGHNLRPPG